MHECAIAGKKLFLFLDTEIGIQNTNIVLFKLAAYIGCVYVGLCWPLTAKNLANEQDWLDILQKPAVWAVAERLDSGVAPCHVLDDWSIVDFSHTPSPLKRETVFVNFTLVNRGLR